MYFLWDQSDALYVGSCGNQSTLVRLKLSFLQLDDRYLPCSQKGLLYFGLLCKKNNIIRSWRSAKSAKRLVVNWRFLYTIIGLNLKSENCFYLNLTAGPKSILYVCEGQPSAHLYTYLFQNLVEFKSSKSV